VEYLKKHFPTFDETQYNVLPMLSEFDIVNKFSYIFSYCKIVTDIDSSVAFESLYFPNKKILAYYHPEQVLSGK
jgi:hypothetical protein